MSATTLIFLIGMALLAWTGWCRIVHMTISTPARMRNTAWLYTVACTAALLAPVAHRWGLPLYPAWRGASWPLLAVIYTMAAHQISTAHAWRDGGAKVVLKKLQLAVGAGGERRSNGRRKYDDMDFSPSVFGANK